MIVPNDAPDPRRVVPSTREMSFLLPHRQIVGLIKGGISGRDGCATPRGRRSGDSSIQTTLLKRSGRPRRRTIREGKSRRGFFGLHSDMGRICQENRPVPECLTSGRRDPVSEETAEIFRVVHIVPDGIPEDRSNLPFVNQSRMGTRQDASWIHPRHGDVVVSLLGLCHVDDALSDLLSGCCLSTPLRPLD